MPSLTQTCCHSMLEGLQSLDLRLFQALTPWHTPWLDRLMSMISLSGTASTIWLIIATTAFVRRTSRAGAWRVYLTILLCFVAVDLILKPAIARPRPVAVRASEPPRALPPMPRSLSFPSGHTAASFGAAVALSRVLPAGRVAWWALAIAMGYSRIYLGHHYPLDVAGGAIVGILVALWVLGGRHPATFAARAPQAPRGAIVRP